MSIGPVHLGSHQARAIVQVVCREMVNHGEEVCFQKWSGQNCAAIRCAHALGQTLRLVNGVLVDPRNLPKVYGRIWELSEKRPLDCAYNHICWENRPYRYAKLKSVLSAKTRCSEVRGHFPSDAEVAVSVSLLIPFWVFPLDLVDN